MRLSKTHLLLLIFNLTHRTRNINKNKGFELFVWHIANSSFNFEPREILYLAIYSVHLALQHRIWFLISIS